MDKTPTHIMEQIIVTTTEQLRAIVRTELESFHQSNPMQAVPQEAGKGFFNLKEVCEYTGLSRQTIYKKTASAEIPHSKRGKRLFFDKAAIDLWILENRVGGSEQATNPYTVKQRKGQK